MSLKYEGKILSLSQKLIFQCPESHYVATLKYSWPKTKVEYVPLVVLYIYFTFYFLSFLKNTSLLYKILDFDHFKSKANLKSKHHFFWEGGRSEKGQQKLLLPPHWELSIPKVEFKNLKCKYRLNQSLYIFEIVKEVYPGYNFSGIMSRFNSYTLLKFF